MTKKDNDNNEIAPDHIIHEGMDKTVAFYNKNKKQLYMVLSGVVVLAGLFWAYNQFLVEPTEREAQEQIFVAQKYFEQDSLDAALKGNASYMGLVDIAEQYGNTKTGNLAKYYAGMCYLKKGEYQNAINYLEDFKASDEIVAPLAEGAIGDANVELGQYEEAVKHFVKAAQMSKNKFTAPIFYKKAGLTYEELKEYKKAVEVYELIKKDYKETSEGQEIDKFIARAKALENVS